MRKPLLAAAVVGLVAVTLGAQAPPAGQTGGGRGGGPAPALRTGTGLILGRVVDGTSTRGIPGAIVDLVAAGVQQQRVQSDAEGRFLFRDLPSGAVTLRVEKSGYLGGVTGQRVPRGPARPLELADGERLGDVTLRLWKYGVIGGTVADDRGDPVVGLQVYLVERTIVEGRTQYAMSLREGSTDDRGAYRFSTVPPGEYLVLTRSDAEAGRALASVLTSDLSALTSIMMRAMGGGGDRLEDMVGLDTSLKGYPPVFYPSVALPSQASVISIKSGEERIGLDLRTRRVPLVRVAGMITDQGQPVAQMSVRLLIADEPGHEIVIESALTTPTGLFAFLAVPAGRYILRGTAVPRSPAERGRGAGPAPQPPPLPSGPTLSVTTTVNAGEAELNLALETTRGTPWRGRVVFEGNAPVPEALASFAILSVVNVDSAPGEFMAPLLARVNADGTLATVGIPPGRFRLRASSSPSWTAKSAIANGQDLLDVPFESGSQEPPDILLTFSDRPPATLSGSVRNARGDADADAIVFVFPADPRLRGDLSATSRRLRAARTTKAGYYAMPGLPAGEYLVAVGTDELVDTWRQPAVLDRLTPAALRIEIADGVSRTIDLRRGADR